MKQITKKRLIIGLITLVTLVNLASLGAIVYLRYYADGSYDVRRPSARVDGRKRFEPDRQTRRLFDESRKQFFEKVRPVAKELHANQSMIMEELMKENPDRDLLDSLAQQSGILYATIRKNMTDVFIEMNKKANPQQKQHLKRFYRHFMMDDRAGPHHERRHRNRKGRKFENRPQGFSD